MKVMYLGTCYLPFVRLSEGFRIVICWNLLVLIARSHSMCISKFKSDFAYLVINSTFISYLNMGRSCNLYTESSPSLCRRKLGDGHTVCRNLFLEVPCPFVYLTISPQICSRGTSVPSSVPPFLFTYST